MTAQSTYEQVRSQLGRLNISFDIQTIEDIHKFICEHIGSLYETNPRLHIPAAAAIICQSKKIPTIGGLGYTTTGIKVENIMRHLSVGVSKEEYLQVIKTQIQKWNNPDHILGEKINKLNISFRIFKKFKAIFEELSIQARISRDMMTNFLSFFWLLFLLTKLKKGVIEDINHSTKILAIALEQAFTTYVGNLQHQKINECILRGANFSSIPSISEAEKNQIAPIIENLIQEAILNRTNFQSFSPISLLNDKKLLARMVDDLSTQYEREYRNLPQGHYIDEMTYLELTKDLTPQVTKTATKFTHQISKVLNFNENQMDEEFDETTENFLQKTQLKAPTFNEIPDQNSQTENFKITRKISFGPFINQRNHHEEPTMTPITLNMAKQQWAKKYIEDFNQQRLQTMRNVVKAKQIEYRQLENESQGKINEQIEELTPQLHQVLKQRQKTDTIKLYCSLIIQLSETSNAEKILKQRKNFKQILCLSGCLYSAILKNQNIDFLKYCSIYEINILQGAKMLFYIGESLNLPKHISNFLAELEKQILIKEIWESSQGYSLIRQRNQPKNQILMNRLYRHISARITEICQNIQIDTILPNKIQELIKSIIQEKPELLQKNKLDQIIICSITTCLDLNKAKHSQALNTIFHYYNSTSYSYYSNCEGLYCKEGNSRMNLMEFYNNVFLLEVEDIMKNQETLSFLLTPIRKQHLNTKKFSGSIPPISKMLNKSSPKGGFGLATPSSDYRKNILSKLSGLPKQKQISQEQVQSPSFKQLGMKRTFTFGRTSP